MVLYWSHISLLLSSRCTRYSGQRISWRKWGYSLKNTTHTASAKLLFLLTLLAVLLGGCGAHSAAVHTPANSTAQQEAIAPQADDDEFELEDEFEAAAVEPPIDPLSGYNRVMTQVNDKLLLAAQAGFQRVSFRGA